MRIKFGLIVVFITLSSCVFSQDTLKLKDSVAKNLAPVEGKAIIYIIRPTEFGFLVKMKVYCDSTYIGSTMAQKYLYIVLNTGKHIFISKSENKYKLEVTLEPGKIYYIKQQVQMGMLYAETKLKVLSDEEGKAYLKKCELSKDNIYTN